MQAQPTYQLLSREEILAEKIVVWEARLAYARKHNRGFVAECERALVDLRRKLSAS